MSRIEMEQRITVLETKADLLQAQIHGLHADLGNLAGRVEALRTTFKEWLENLREDVHART